MELWTRIYSPQTGHQRQTTETLYASPAQGTSEFVGVTYRSGDSEQPAQAEFHENRFLGVTAGGGRVYSSALVSAALTGSGLGNLMDVALPGAWGFVYLLRLPQRGICCASQSPKKSFCP